MKQNVGTIDRIIRVASGAVLAGLGFTGVIAGAAGIITGVVGVVLIVTGAVGFCPLYAALGLSTHTRAVKQS